MEELLYLTHRIPYPPNKGDKIRSFHMLRHLSKRYRVHLGTFIDDEADWQHVDATRAFCGESHFARLNPSSGRLRSLSGLLTGKPLTLPYYHNADLQQWVNDLLTRRPIQRVLVFSSAMAQYVEQAEARRRVIDFVDIDSDKWTQYAGSKRWPLSMIYRREGRLLLEYERKIASEFDASLFVSSDEAALFRKLAPESAEKTDFFSNGVDAEHFSPEQEYPNPYPADEQVMVFTGAMDYWPNVDAVRWFAEEVFPTVRAARPAARFYIVGSRPSETVRALADLPAVVVTGTVPDVRPYLAHASLAIAPLRIARGLQNKVLEAMSMEKAVVASPQAAEGIQAAQGTELEVADAPEQYAGKILGLLESEARTAMGRNARARILRDYDWDSSLAKLDALLAASLNSGATPSTHTTQGTP